MIWFCKKFRNRISEDDLLEVHDLSVQLALAFGTDHVKEELDDESVEKQPESPDDLEEQLKEQNKRKSKATKPPQRILTRRVTCQLLMAYCLRGPIYNLIFWKEPCFLFYFTSPRALIS